MPIRGKRSIWPQKPRKPSGIFSTSGKQKQDGTPFTSAQEYAHRNTSVNGRSTKEKLATSSPNKRHNPPAAGKSTRCSLPK